MTHAPTHPVAAILLGLGGPHASRDPVAVRVAVVVGAGVWVMVLVSVGGRVHRSR